MINSKIINVKFKIPLEENGTINVQNLKISMNNFMSNLIDSKIRENCKSDFDFFYLKYILEDDLIGNSLENLEEIRNILFSFKKSEITKKQSEILNEIIKCNIENKEDFRFEKLNYYYRGEFL